MPKKLEDQNQDSFFTAQAAATNPTFIESTASLASGPNKQEQSADIYAQPRETTSANWRSEINRNQAEDAHENTKTTITARRRSRAGASNINTDRFSCNELECLKERFVDFIQLKDIAQSHTSQTASSIIRAGLDDSNNNNYSTTGL